VVGRRAALRELPPVRRSVSDRIFVDRRRRRRSSAPPPPARDLRPCPGDRSGGTIEERRRGRVDDGPGLQDIDVDECFDLLERCTVGRVAVNVDHLGPLVVPVNFVLDGEVIVFRTDPGTKLRLLSEGPVSFEIDSIDHLHEVGWSVLVRGVASEAEEWEIRHLDVRPWAGGEKAHWIRLVPGVVTGRRIRFEELPPDDRGYR
jgi:hypothetical protein